MAIESQHRALCLRTEMVQIFQMVIFSLTRRPYPSNDRLSEEATESAASPDSPVAQQLSAVLNAAELIYLLIALGNLAILYCQHYCTVTSSPSCRAAAPAGWVLTSAGSGSGSSTGDSTERLQWSTLPLAAAPAEQQRKRKEGYCKKARG